MIDLYKLEPKDVGRWVRYTSGIGETELGRIKSWNHAFIFVVYQCDNNWRQFEDYTAAATDPNDLNFEAARNL